MKTTASLLCTIASAALAGLATPAAAIVGQTSTGSGASSIYLAQGDTYSGVVGIVIDQGADGKYACSGALLSDRRSILTAAHCVAQGTNYDAIARPVSTTIYFDTGIEPDANIYSDEIAGNVEITVSAYTVHSSYTGSATDQHDVAVLTLSELAPSWATSYEIYTGDDLTGVEYTSVGYGVRSTVGGAEGTEAFADVGSRRKGENRYDYRYGDDDFGGIYTKYEEDKNVAHVYTADFDDGTTANDTLCEKGTSAAGLDEKTAKYCNTGRGAGEATTSSGDSGGPQFVDGKIASVTSSGYSLDSHDASDMFGSVDNYSPTYINADFIKSAMIGAIPEPATWMQMLLGFGMLGGALRSVRHHATARIA